LEITVKQISSRINSRTDNETLIQTVPSLEELRGIIENNNNIMETKMRDVCADEIDVLYMEIYGNSL
jgi:hypothetical protein